MLKRMVFLFVLVAAFGFHGFSQILPDDEDEDTNDIMVRRGVIHPRASENRFSPDVMLVNLALAQSSLSYRVTPGDVYTLVYVVGTTPITYKIVVDTSYRIRVANLGVISGAGRTFAQIRTEVETFVTRNHPMSAPQLVLTQPAIFRVFVAGEVYTAGEVPAWGLSRLCSLVDDGNLSRLASIRDISVRSVNGQARVYDLFRFQRLGDQSQNPYLRPGDVVTFNRVDRLVTIEGEVERPGTYQLLPGENLRELVDFFGNGLTPVANPARIEMVRHINSEDVSGDRVFLTGRDLAANFALENYDLVNIPPITQLMPVVFVEGAVDIDLTAELVTTNRVVMRFNTGETYAAMVRRNAEWFSAISDTQNAYIIRRTGERVPIDLSRALFDAAYDGEVLIHDNDTLVIPFRQFFVTVAGAVQNPGRFPFIPDRGWEYYVALAGGFAAGRNAFASVSITDINGRRLRRADAITPETVITARTNHPMHFLSHYIMPVLAVVSTTISIMLIARN